MKPQVNYIPPTQLAQLIDNIPNLHIRICKSDDVAMLFKIAYWCALRMGEAIRLKAEDFDLDMHQVYLGTTKTNKADKASIPPTFLPELELYLKDRAGPLFPKLNYYVVYNWLTRLGKMLNILALITPQSETGEKTVTHIFRKSIAKDYLLGTHGGKKAPVFVAMDKLRHKDLAVFSKYVKMEVEGVKDWESLNVG